MSGTAGDGAPRANSTEEDYRGVHGEDLEDYEDEEDDGYEFGDAEQAMQCVEMAERSTAARAYDYEALAARKRKALAEEQPQREGSSKSPRQDDVSEAEAATMFDQLMEGFGLRRKRRSKEAKKRGRKRGTKNKFSPEVTKKLGDATLLFTESKFKETPRPATPLKTPSLRPQQDELPTPTAERPTPASVRPTPTPGLPTPTPESKVATSGRSHGRSLAHSSGSGLSSRGVC